MVVEGLKGGQQTLQPSVKSRIASDSGARMTRVTCNCILRRPSDKIVYEEISMPSDGKISYLYARMHPGLGHCLLWTASMHI